MTITVILDYDGGQRRGSMHFIDPLDWPDESALAKALEYAEMYGAEACWCEP